MQLPKLLLILALPSVPAIAGSLVFRQQDLGFGEGFAVGGVELPDNLIGLFQHGLLVFPNRDDAAVEGSDVRRLADGVGEKAHRDAGFKVPHLDFALHRGVSLQPGHGDQVHIVKGQLGELGHQGLDEDGDFIGVQPAGEVVQRHLDDVLPHLFRVVGVVGESLGVGNHHIHFIVISGVLQLHPPAQGAHIVADMEFSGGAVPGEDNFFHGVNSFLNLCFPFTGS